jgi:predicted restriction endonuclease
VQARFRRLVLANAGHRCQMIEHGQRCTVTSPLEAHHTMPGNDDPARGVALCVEHHRMAV